MAAAAARGVRPPSWVCGLPVFCFATSVESTEKWPQHTAGLKKTGSGLTYADVVWK
jgi:hypothetical protein